MLQCDDAPVLLTRQSWASITKAPLRHSALERHLICGGNLSHKQPRGDFNIYSAVCSAYVSFGKQLTLAHYTQMKADLQTGQRPHSLCGEVSPSYEAMSLFTSLPLRHRRRPPPLCPCILNSATRPSVANERAPADMMYTVRQYGPDVF